MILQVASDAPLIVKAATGALLVAHIGGASLGIASGTVSILARKGGRLHRGAGNVFFVAMLAMSAAAAVTAPFLPDRLSAMMGVVTFYLVATAWAAVRRPAGQVGRFETAAAGAAFAIAGIDLMLGMVGAQTGGRLDGQPSQVMFVFAAIALMAGAMDVRMIRRGGITGPARIARHLWRMTLALFIVWGSWAAQQKAVPAAWWGNPATFLPALTTLGLLAFWMIRTRWPRRARRPTSTVALKGVTS